ncbi:MAG: TetR/AcrR family transcriptional regulator [Pseudobutyrivibrio sp.]|nr:TetR/AcrR family transcriptional regulator [Pseudobutyrivibrio sp.]
MTKAEKMELFHRDNIANAAEKLFSANGIDKTSMDQIAKEADYSKSTIYVYFKNKEEIVLFLVLKGMNEIRTNIEEVVDNNSDATSEVEKYYQICHILTELYDKSPFVFSRMLETIEMKKEERLQVPLLDDIYQVGESIIDKIAEFLESGKGNNSFVLDDDSHKVGFIYWMILAGVITLGNKKAGYIEYQFDESKEEFLNQVFGMMLGMIKNR